MKDYEFDEIKNILFGNIENNIIFSKCNKK